MRTAARLYFFYLGVGPDQFDLIKKLAYKTTHSQVYIIIILPQIRRHCENLICGFKKRFYFVILLQTQSFNEDWSSLTNSTCNRSNECGRYRQMVRRNYWNYEFHGT